MGREEIWNPCQLTVINLLVKSTIIYTCVSDKTIEDGLASGV